MGPLEGVRVVDLTKVIAGPLCTQYLGDLGADVIKIEPVEGGDDTRQWPPVRQGTGSVFLSVNRNKRSVALDLKSDAGQNLLHRLVSTADIVIESFTPGVVERLGADYATLLRHKPDLIYCSVSGFGRTGPLSNARGYDLVLQAFSGAMSMTGEPGGVPIRMPLSPIDQATGLHALSGILAALFQRGRTGKGAMLEVSLFETSIGLLGFNLQRYWERGILPEKSGSGHESLCPYRVFQASDAELLVGVANDRLWQRFCEATGHPELLADARFRTNADRVRNIEITNGIVEDIIATRPRAEWLELLGRLGVPCAPINTLEEIMAHPQTAARGMVMDYDHPTLGALKSIAHPVQIDGGVREVSRPAPMLGEHTAEVLAGLGLDAISMQTLAAQGVISGPGLA